MNSILGLRCAFCLLCLLAAQNPWLFAIKLRGLLEFAKTYTKYGKLPEIQIPVAVYIAQVLAVILLVAVVLEFLKFRMAAPVGLFRTVTLWAYYLPGIWYELSGDFGLEAVFGTTTPIIGNSASFKLEQWRTPGFELTSDMCLKIQKLIEGVWTLSSFMLKPH